MSILKVRKWSEKKLRSIMFVILVVFTVSCFYFYGGTLTPPTEEETDPHFGIVAKVNRSEITRQEFDNNYSNALRFYTNVLQQPIKLVNLIDIKSGVLDEMIEREIKLQEAKTQKIKVSKKEIENKINQTAKDYKISRKELEKRISSIGQNMELFKAGIKEDLMIENLQKKIKDSVVVKEQDIKDKYEQVKASHILLKIPEAKDEKDRELQDAQTKEKAKKILEEYNKGADFAELAKKYSEDPASKDNGGDLGFFSRGQMVKEFENAAFLLKPGQVSDIIKTQYGYHIIKCVAKKEAKGQDFEKERTKIAKELKETKQQQELKNWLDGLKKRAKVEIFDLEIKAHKKSLEGKTDEAIKIYEEYISKNPYNSYAYYSLAKLQEKQNKLAEAEKNYKKAVENNENDADLYFALAALQEKRNNKESAIINFKKADNLAEKDISLRYSLQEAFKRLGLTQEEEKQKEKIAKIQKEMQKKFEEQQRQLAEEKVEKIEPLKVEVGKKAKEPLKVEIGEEEMLPVDKKKK